MKKEVLDLLDLNTPQRYTLSIRFSPDGFCFSLYDRLANGNVIPFFYKIDAVTSELANIKCVLDDIGDLLKCSFFKVYILLDTDRVTAVPVTMSDEDDLNTAYSFCYALQPGDEVMSAVSDISGCILVFSVNKYVRNLLEDSFGDVVFIPSSCPVLDYGLMCSRKLQSKTMFVYIGIERILIAAFDLAELLFFNKFDCDNDNDRLFYIMNVWNTVLFSQTDDKLMLVSDSSTGTDRLERLLGNYIAEIEYVKRNKELVNIFSKNGITLNFDLEVLLTHNIMLK